MVISNTNTLNIQYSLWNTGYTGGGGGEVRWKRPVTEQVNQSDCS